MNGVNFLRWGQSATATWETIAACAAAPNSATTAAMNQSGTPMRRPAAKARRRATPKTAVPIHVTPIQ